MPTTKAQREAACAIIEKFTADDVTFPVEFVLALLNDAERLGDAIKDRYEAIRERDAAITDAVSFSNMYKEAEYEFQQLKRTYFSMLEDAGTSSVQEIIDERDILAERVLELEGEVAFWKEDDSTAQRLFLALEAAEAKLAVAVEALETIKIGVKTIQDRVDGEVEVWMDWEDFTSCAVSAISKIKGAS